MRFIPRILKRIGAVCLGLLSLLPGRTHSKTDPGAEELSYNIDTEMISVEEDPACDPGNYNGKSSKDIAFTVIMPLAEPPAGTHVAIGVSGRTKVTLKQPIVLGQPFDMKEVVTVKYPIIKPRNYEVSASGTLDRQNIETVIRMRRLGKPKEGKTRFCEIKFRIKKTGQT